MILATMFTPRAKCPVRSEQHHGVRNYNNLNIIQPLTSLVHPTEALHHVELLLEVVPADELARPQYILVSALQTKDRNIFSVFKLKEIERYILCQEENSGGALAAEKFFFSFLL